MWKSDWLGVGKQPIFNKIDSILKDITAALGGTKIKNPVWNKQLDSDLITVHPLGRCAMADSADNGVVNHKEELLKSDNGTDVHKGLYVCNGALGHKRSLGLQPAIDHIDPCGKVLQVNSKRQRYIENFYNLCLTLF